MKTRRRGIVIGLCTLALASSAGGQSVQYRSPEGTTYRSQRDTGAIARAEKALAANPNSIDAILALGAAQSGARQFREAIATYTRGLSIAPRDARLYRWRGHRYLSVREHDNALADLERGGAIDSTLYGIWYHLGVLRFLKGQFAAAATAFARAWCRSPRHESWPLPPPQRQATAAPLPPHRKANASP